MTRAFRHYAAGLGRRLQLEDWVQQLQELVPVSLVLLDASRDNPFLERHLLGATKGAERGVELQMSVSRRTLMVLYASAKGAKASDGEGSDDCSPFARALTDHLHTKEALQDVVHRFVARVEELTSNKQHPWHRGNLTDSVYLAGQCEKGKVWREDQCQEKETSDLILKDKDADGVPDRIDQRPDQAAGNYPDPKRPGCPRNFGRGFFHAQFDQDGFFASVSTIGIGLACLMIDIALRATANSQSTLQVRNDFLISADKLGIASAVLIPVGSVVMIVSLTRNALAARKRP